MNESRVERRPQQLLALRLRDLEKIAEEIIVLKLELTRLGELAIARLQGCDHRASFVAQRAGFVEAGVETWPHETAVAALQGQIVGKRLAKPGGQCGVDRGGGGACLAQLLRRLRRPAKRGAERGGGDEAVPHGGEIARAAAIERETGERASQIRRRLERHPRLAPQDGLLEEKRNRVMAPGYVPDAGQRARRAARRAGVRPQP